MLTWAYRIGYAAAGLALVVISALIDRQVVHWAPIIGVHVAGVVGVLAFAFCGSSFSRTNATPRGQKCISRS
jgi:hypothetical protein